MCDDEMDRAGLRSTGPPSGRVIMGDWSSSGWSKKVWLWLQIGVAKGEVTRIRCEECLQVGTTKDA